MVHGNVGAGLQNGNTEDVKPARTIEEGNIGDIARVMPYNANRNIIHYYYRINRGCNVLWGILQMSDKHAGETISQSI